jgi:hypothetical protein
VNITGDLVAAPYIRRDWDAIEAVLPSEVEKVTVTHGGHTFSAYFWIKGERVAESHNNLTVLGAVQKAAYDYRQRVTA